MIFTFEFISCSKEEYLNILFLQMLSFYALYALFLAVTLRYILTIVFISELYFMLFFV